MHQAEEKYCEESSRESHLTYVLAAAKSASLAAAPRTRNGYRQTGALAVRCCQKHRCTTSSRSPQALPHQL